MKKIIAILSLSLAFTINTNAQEAKKVAVSGYEKSKSEAVELQSLLGLTDGLTADLTTLLEMKREVMENLNSSDEAKAEMARVVGLKIQASLTDEQLQKLVKNQAVLNRVSGQADLKKK